MPGRGESREDQEAQPADHHTGTAERGEQHAVGAGSVGTSGDYRERLDGEPVQLDDVVSRSLLVVAELRQSLVESGPGIRQCEVYDRAAKIFFDP
ncbi:hypothetical protein [Streptomyces chartreusis]